MMTGTIPQKLKDSALFCTWRYEQRDGKPTKVPYDPRTGSRARSNDAATFASYAEADARAKAYDGLGIGVFGDLGAIDIDNCINEEGKLSEMAEDVVSMMDAYTEISPSGRGIRILFLAPGFRYDTSKYYINKSAIGLEVYIAGATSKYVTVTGNTRTPGVDLMDRTSNLVQVLDKYMQRHKRQQAEPGAAYKSFFVGENNDARLIEKACKSDARFAALWRGGPDVAVINEKGDPSYHEAELALCNRLAFWTGKDAAQMDRLFRQSGLMRDKWNRRESGGTYGSKLIQKAISDCTATYNPQEYFKKKAAAAIVDFADSKITLADLKPESNPRYGWHDMGNGYLFADWYKSLARYVPERKKWFVFDGKVWRPDEGDLKVAELCKKLADQLMIYTLSLEEGDTKQNYLKFVARWQRRSCRETIIKEACSVYPVMFDQFDKNPYLFNCQNGTLDLESGEFYAHKPEDLLSKLAGVEYAPDAHSERWERFIDEVMQGDEEKAAFLQKALGYALTGDTRHECFFILYGRTSRNGKGTTMETFLRLLGEYGSTAVPDTIAQQYKPNGGGPSEDIARLAGARFVNMSEPDKKMVLSAAKVKQMTGNDTITARFLHENSFEYRPEFKLFINTNYLPQVTDITLFASGRVKVIPFERHFTESEQDKGLKSELARRENLSGILNWCIEGLKLIDSEGFDAPGSVLAATNDYRMNSDKISRFLDEEMEVDPLAETRSAEVYARYKQWCEVNGYRPENAANFKTLLSNAGEIKRKRPADGGGMTTMFIGYKLTPDDGGFIRVENPVPWDDLQQCSSL